MVKTRILSLHIVPGECEKDVQQIEIILSDAEFIWKSVLESIFLWKPIFTNSLVQSEKRSKLSVLLPEDFQTTDFFFWSTNF